MHTPSALHIVGATQSVTDAHVVLHTPLCVQVSGKQWVVEVRFVT